MHTRDTSKAIQSRRLLAQRARMRQRVERVKAAKTSLTGTRQEGRLNCIADKYAKLLSGNLPEITIAEFLSARQHAEFFLRDSGDRWNDSVLSYIERKLQERLLDASQKSRNFHPSWAWRQTVMRQAILNIRFNLGECGNAEGQTECPILAQKDGVEYLDPEVEITAHASANPLLCNHPLVDAVKEFVSSSTDSAEQEQACWNLLADYCGHARPFRLRDTDRMIAEQSDELHAAVESFVASMKLANGGR